MSRVRVTKTQTDGKNSQLKGKQIIHQDEHSCLPAYVDKSHKIENHSNNGRKDLKWPYS